MRALMYALPLFIAVAVTPSWAAQETFIWIEGENLAKSSVFDNPWFNDVDADELSGGAWLASFSEPNQPTGTAEYLLDIPRAGEYRFWLRANPRGTGIAYRLDDGPWQRVDVDAMRRQVREHRREPDFEPRMIQETPVALDGGWDARFLAWFDLGSLDLSAGEHRIAFQLGGTEAEKRFSALDCFVLTTGEFTPRHKYRPGERPQSIIEYPDEETWAFEPEDDAFSEEALFDLRALNEEFAGQHGFIRRSEDGFGFVRGDGVPIRFWGGSTYVQRNAWRDVERTLRRAEQLREQGREEDAHRSMERAGELRQQAWEELRHHARFLAKRGVNMVRNHGAVQPKREGSQITDVDQQAVEQIWRLVAAMKEQGIYCTISPYWGSHARRLKSWDVPESGLDNMAGMLFFEPKTQAAYKSWLKAIYDPVNPYTGVRLADDPAVAIIQVQNEDSMLFYTMQRVQGEARAILRRQYADWLSARYGSLAAARKAWNGNEQANDDFANGEAGLYIVWHFGRDAKQGMGSDVGLQRRLSDQFEFMARTMHAFNAEVERYLEEELGCRHLVNAGNWRTVDAVLVDPAERWSYTANDVIGKNHYYSPAHLGLHRGWQILAGHYFQDLSVIPRPERLPLNVKQAVGHPFIIPESLWVPPLSYQAEGPLMIAAQQCLTGVDCFYWFATGVREWQPPGNKWTFSTPMQLGQFPAAALIWRRGLVDEGEPVVYEERGLHNIWERRTPIIAEGGSYDPNRDAGDLPADSSIQGGVDPLAFVIGPVHVRYEGDPANNQLVDLTRYIDEDAGIVRSVTGQITTDRERGVYQVNAPRAQGAAGFLADAGPLKMADVGIDCANHYASIVVVPLDDQPLATSARLLIQVGTRCRPTGWQARPAQFKADDKLVQGKRIVRVGTAPWRVINTRATVTVANQNVQGATLLDVNGMPVRDVPVRREGRMLIVALPSDSMYVVLR